MTKTIQAVRGMNDILPDEAALWQCFEDTVRAWLRAYGYPRDPHAGPRAHRSFSCARSAK